eukprot:1013555-Pyramimonas_sp.AAC.1
MSNIIKQSVSLPGARGSLVTSSIVALATRMPSRVGRYLRFPHLVLEWTPASSAGRARRVAAVVGRYP